MTDLAVMQIQQWRDGVITPTDDTAHDDANPFGTPKTADIALSLAVMERSKPTPKQCFRNSLLAYWPACECVRQEQATDDNAQLYYVEGQLVMPITGGGRIAIEHAWLETEEGRVIETTLHKAAKEPGWAYFTGLRLTISDALLLIGRNHNTLPLIPVAQRSAPDAAAYARAVRAAYWHAWGVDLADLAGK